MVWIIDRIEGDVAVCEIDAGITIDVPIASLPENIKEGDVISLTIDNDLKNNRKEKINKLADSLFVD